MNAKVQKHRIGKHFAFAQRLGEAMRKRGYKRKGGRQGADALALARNIDVSYEMARRYLAGIARPSHQTQRAIEAWLELPANHLDGPEDEPEGEGEPMKPEPAPAAYQPNPYDTNRVDSMLLRECVEAVIIAGERSKVKLGGRQIAQISAWVYADSRATHREPSADDLTELLSAFS